MGKKHKKRSKNRKKELDEKYIYIEYEDLVGDELFIPEDKFIEMGHYGEASSFNQGWFERLVKKRVTQKNKNRDFGMRVY